MTLRKDRVRLWLAILAIAAAMSAVAIWDTEIFSFVMRAEARDASAATREDLDELENLVRKDHSFSAAQKAEFAAGLAELHRNAATLSPAAFFMGVRKLVAIPRNGHTNTMPPQPYGYVPLRFVWFAEGLFIVRATQPYADLLGAQVLAVHGRDLDEAIAALRPYISLTDEPARNRGSIGLLGTPALLQVIWPEVDGTAVTLKLKRPDGRITDHVIPAAEPMFMGFGPVKGQAPFPQLIPPVPERDGPAWKAVLPAGKAPPMSLREPTHAVFTQNLENGGLYLRMNQVFDDDHGDLDDQLEAVVKRAPAGGWRTVVLDMRFNNGGDYYKSLEFTEALPKAIHPDGKLWILTTNTTFSAAIVTLARIKHFTGPRAHIVGEKVGDKDRFWAEGGRIELKNSKIRVNYADGMHDWVNGCDAACFKPNFKYGVAAGDLTPEIKVEWSFADYLAGRDTVMEKVMEFSGK